MKKRIKSILPWNFDVEKLRGVPRTTYPNLEFRAVLDKRYLVEVQRTRKRSANLVVFDHEKKDRLIACWRVRLRYGTKLGPGVNDIELWRKKVIDFIDEV